MTEAESFFKKGKELIETENISKAVMFVLCAGGFTDEAAVFFRENGIAWSESEE